MKVVEIVNNRVHREYPEFATVDDAYKKHSKSLLFVECPDNIQPGFGYDGTKQGNDRFIRPQLSEGWEYDDNGYPWNPEQQRAGERIQYHALSTNDTMQALRKIREGDTTIDWSKWLDTLDAYNVAIERTREQEGYPHKVIYPEYPVKPIS